MGKSCTHTAAGDGKKGEEVEEGLNNKRLTSYSFSFLLYSNESWLVGGSRERERERIE